MFPFVCGVRYLPICLDPKQEVTEQHTNVLVYASTFSEATAQVEEYFGDELIAVTLEAVADTGTLFEVSDEIANSLTLGEGSCI